MASWDKDEVFCEQAIRDTAEHESDYSYIGEFTAETIVYHNTLDQAVTLQYQGSVDDVIWIDIGSPIVVAANTNDYETVNDFFPEYKVLATCDTAPTSGNLCVYILKAGGK